MQGHHLFDPKANICFSLDSFIPPKHILRKIDKQVDFTFIKKLTLNHYCSNNGRPSIDPEVFFRMLVVAYLYNIDSDRKLCEEVNYNLAYRWFCHLSLKDKIPEHSCFTRIRDRFTVELFKQIFAEIVRQCQSKGLIKDRVVTDSSLIAANASLDSLVANSSIEAEKEKIEVPQRGIHIAPRKISNATHTSKTDPQATLAMKPGKPRGLKYKIHLTADADSRIILNTKVTTGACHDSKVYIQQIKEISKENKLTIKEAIADRAYGSGEIINELINLNITPYLPLFHVNTGRSILKISDGFIYEDKYDRYRCPTGHYLLPYSKIYGKRVKYRSKVKDCSSCEYSKNCSAKRLLPACNRYIERNIHQALYEETQKRMKMPIFADKLVERFWKIEGIISEAKNRHGLSRARYRGLDKVQIQAYLSATVQNMKRIINIFIVLCCKTYFLMILPQKTTLIVFVKTHLKLLSKINFNEWLIQRVFQQPRPFVHKGGHFFEKSKNTYKILEK